MTLLKLIFGVVAFIVAFIFSFLMPGSGAEQMIVEVVAGIAGAFGLTSWRNNYGTIKEWYQSKTIVSAVIVAIGIIALAVISFFSLGAPEWLITIITGVVSVFGGGTLIGIFHAMKKNSASNKLSSFFFLLIGAAAAIILDNLFFGTAAGISFAALTTITGTTKAASEKTARQRSFAAKEDTGDTAVTVPAHALKSVECKIKGVNDDGAFGKNTIGQEIEGKLMLYTGEAALRTFAHELVTKDIEWVQLTTNGGKTFTFSTSDNTPALSFAYEEASLVSAKDDPDMITLIISGYRDNLVMS